MDNGGALHFDADLDDRKMLVKFANSEARAEQWANNVVRSANKIDQSFSGIGDSLQTGKFGGGINAAENRIKYFQDQIVRGNALAGNSFDSLSAKLGSGNFGSNLTNAQNKLAGLGRVAVNANSDAKRSFEELGNSAGNEGMKLTGIYSNLTNVIAGFLTINAAQAFVGKVIDIRTEFENLDVAFSTILKSKEKADRLMSEVIDFAATTPFGLTEVAKSTKQLLAYGVAAEDVKDELNTLGNIAAGVSQPIGEVAYLYGTLKTQGRAYAMDIRQFTGRGIPIIQALADVLGVAKGEVMGLVEQGKIGFPEVQKAFQNLTSAGGSFYNLMQKQSLTTGGRIANLKDQIDLMLNAFGEANTGIINSGISGLNSLVANYQTIIDTLKAIVTIYGSYRAALALTAVANKLNAAATAANIASLETELAAKNAVVLQSKAYAGVMLTEAEARAVNAASSQILAAQETASLTRKAALTAASEFYTAKQVLETEAKAGASAATLLQLRAEVQLLAAKSAEATATATAAAAELAAVEVRTVAAAATVRLSAVQLLAAVRTNLVAKATQFLNSVMVATPVIAMTLAFATLVGVVYALRNANNTAAEAHERLLDIQVEANKQASVEQEQVKSLVKLANDKTLSHDQQAAALKKLISLNPEFLNGLTQANINTAEGSRIIKLYLQDLNNKAAGELAYAAKLENTKKIMELQTKGSSAIPLTERVGTGINNFVTGKLFNSKIIRDSKEGEKFLVNQKIEQLENANKQIDQKYGKQIKEFQLKGLEVPKTTGTAKAPVRNEIWIEAEIKRLQDLRSAQALSSKAYKDYTGQINALQAELRAAQGKTSQEQRKGESDRLKALEAIRKAEESSLQKGLSDSDEKIQKAKDEAEQLRVLARKGKLGQGAFTQIDRIEQTTTGNIRYDLDTQNLLSEVNKQKEVYAKYEEFRTNTSEKAAKDRYQNEVFLFKNFNDYLNNEIKPLQESAGKGELTGREADRLSQLLDVQKKYNADLKAEEEKKYSEAYSAAKTYGDEVNEINIKYAALAVALGKDATNERTSSLLQERDKAIEAAKDEALQKTAIYKNLSTEVILYSKKETEEQIKNLQKLIASGKIPNEFVAKIGRELSDLKVNLKLGVDQGNLSVLKTRYNALLTELNSKDSEGKSIISETEYERIMRELQDIEDKIKGIDVNGDGKASFSDKVSENFKYLKGDSEDIATGISNDLSRAAGGFNELSSALGGTDTEAGYALDTIGKLAQVGSDAAGSFAAFASGDIVGGVTKAISAVAGLFSIGKKVKEMNAAARAEVAQFYADAASGEIEYQTLLRDRERKLLEINAIGTKGIQDQTKALQAQRDEINKSYVETLKRLQAEQKIVSVEYTHGTWFRKAKTEYTMGSLSGVNDFAEFEKLYTSGVLTDGAKKLFEELRKLKEEGADVEEALKSAAVAAAELATGTTAANLSSQIIESLKQGKSGLVSVMDDYTTIIRDALLSTFKSDIVDVEMKAFYERLAALSQSDGELTKDEIAQAKLDYEATRARIQKAFDDQQKITGVNLTDPGASNQSGIAASVKSLSQDTGIVIEGLMRGIYDIIKRNGVNSNQNTINLAQQLNILNQQLALQVEIRDNTGNIMLNTANQLIKSDAIIQQLQLLVTGGGIPQQTPRGAGIASPNP